MSLPIPKPGLVIRYSFLWSSEQATGATEGAKDRPCAIVVAARRDPKGDVQTIVAPITHRPPEDPGASIEIPAATCRHLGLDSGRHWLRLDELNRFAWLGSICGRSRDGPANTATGCCRPISSSGCAKEYSPDRRHGPDRSFHAISRLPMASNPRFQRLFDYFRPHGTF